MRPCADAFEFLGSSPQAICDENHRYRACISRLHPSGLPRTPEIDIESVSSDNMGYHRSRRPQSPDSGYDTTSDGSVSPISTKKNKHHVLQSSSAQTYSVSLRPRSIEEKKISLLANADRVDLTESIGTQLSDVQLSELNAEQLQELAALVAERGVVFFRNQDLAAEDQFRILDPFGPFHERHIVSRSAEHVKFQNDSGDHGEQFTHSTGSRSQWVSDRSFEANPPTFSILKAEETGGDTTWVSEWSSKLSCVLTLPRSHNTGCMIA